MQTSRGDFIVCMAPKIPNVPKPPPPPQAPQAPDYVSPNRKKFGAPQFGQLGGTLVTGSAGAAPKPSNLGSNTLLGG